MRLNEGARPSGLRSLTPAFGSSTVRLIREFSWIATGQAAAIAGSIVGVRLLTGAVPPAAYGTVALVLTIGTPIQQILTGPLIGAALRFFSASMEAGDFLAYARSVRRLLSRICGAVSLLGVAAVAGLILTGHRGTAEFAALAVVYALLVSINALLNGLQNAARHRAIVAWHQAAESWLRYLLAVACVYAFGSSARSVLFGYLSTQTLILASQIAFAVPQFHAARQRSQEVATPQPRDWQAMMVSYGWPFALWGIFTFLQLSSDRWALDTFRDKATVGFFAALSQLGYFPATLLSNLGLQFIPPILFGMAGDGSSRERVGRVYRVNNIIVAVVLAATAVAALIAAALHRQLFAWLVAPAYHGVSGWLPWMVVAGGLFASSQFAVQSLFSESSTTRVIPAKIGSALIAVAANFAGAYWYGLGGVIMALIFSNLVLLVWCQVLAFRQSRHGTVMPSAGHR